MNSAWLITSFTVVALFGAITVLPTLHKTIQTQNSAWPVSFWSLETLRTFGEAPLIFTLISASILSGWAWGSAVSWLLITLIFGLLMLPLTDYGFDSLDNQRSSNNWKHKITRYLFLIASLSILIKIVIGLVVGFPEIGSATLLFVILMAFNRYSSKASLILLIFGLICGAVVSANISITVDAETRLLTLLLSSFVLASLFALSPNRASKTALSVLSGLGTIILALTLIAAGLLDSGETALLNTPNEPALPLICLVLLLPGLLPGTDRSGRSKASFSTISTALSSSHLLVYITGMVIVIAIISMSDSFVSSLSIATIDPIAQEPANMVLSNSLYSASFAPETIVTSMIGQLINALSIDDAYVPTSTYIIVLSLVLGIIQLAIKQLESILKMFRPSTSTKEHTTTSLWLVNIAPWLIGAAIVITIMFVPNLSLWLSCSASFAVLIVQQFCTRSLKLSDAHPATRIYLSLSLILILGLALQLIYLTVSSGLQKQFGVAGVVLLLLLLHMLHCAPQIQVLFSKLKKTQGSALGKLKNL